MSRFHHSLLLALAAPALFLPACTHVGTAPGPAVTLAGSADPSAKAQPAATLAEPVDPAAEGDSGQPEKPPQNGDDLAAGQAEPAPAETVPEPRPAFLPVSADANGDGWDSFRQRVCVDLDYACNDYRHFYSPWMLGGLALGIGAAAPLANTDADIHFRNWYQRQGKSHTGDEISTIVNYAGQLWIVIPAGLELAALSGHAAAGYQLDGCWFEWSNRCLRAMAVGAPPMLALYVVLGAERPARNDSAWRPFADAHGVSGHTFFAAVPLLTAARMTDRPWLKVPLWAASFVPAWSRINDDRHYLSQVVLGWWLAWLSVCSVDETQRERRCWQLAPLLGPETTGAALQVSY